MSRDLRMAEEGNEIVGGNFTESAAEPVHVSLAHAVTGLLADAINDYGDADVDGTSAPSSPTGLDVKSKSSVSVPTSYMTPKQASQDLLVKRIVLVQRLLNDFEKTYRINRQKCTVCMCTHMSKLSVT